MTEHSCWLTATCELVYFVYAEEPVLSLGQNPSAKMDHIDKAGLQNSMQSIMGYHWKACGSCAIKK